MSFSGEIKKELAGRIGESRHCRLAELSAIIVFAGKISALNGGISFRPESGNPMLKEKFARLVSLLFSIDREWETLQGDDVFKILEGVKLWDRQRGCFLNTETADGLLIQQSCCKRAYIRGAFLSSGSVSDPGKAYHFEIVCRTAAQSAQLQHAINSFDIDARIVPRKKNQVVYVKEGAHIVDLLNVMEAHTALMNLENVRIVKEMRNSVNRQVNCETANISKIVNAAVRQIEDIRLIQKNKGIESLPEHLKEIALLRLAYPDAPLKELGMYLNPPVGKSGVNHRLRRISEIAEKMGE
ncbi:sporulation transcription regulator WhiA [Lachnospiraceae bacterium]|nr:DNA-binding protein WhiA [Eubacterium sp.]GFI27221.1 sporulation transcription regulator WhiA [Lachnospiraceae bacterium]